MPLPVPPRYPTAAQSGLLQAMWEACQGAPEALTQVSFSGAGELPSPFSVTDLASASIATAGLAVASLAQSLGRTAALPTVTVDRRLASFWFGLSVRPQGWSLPPVWDVVAGDYRARDGWIRLHTNAPHHRAAAMAVLQVPVDREAVAQAVARWTAVELESAVVGAGGCAGAMHSWSDWQQHPQGQAVLSEPVLHWRAGAPASHTDWAFNPQRPLSGIRVLDMTRVLAGPVATRLLAALGAEVLRIDPPGWEEAVLEPEITLGKRCARLDLHQRADRQRWESLLQGADVLVHGYRSDALEALGLGTERRQQLRPGLIDVALDAYGFTGPWKARRGFDSIVQMSMGFAEQGQRSTGAVKPVPLPVQALDHATGYLLAAATVRALEQRAVIGTGSIIRASLARTGTLLMATGGNDKVDSPALAPETPDDWDDHTEKTVWGPARRVRWPLQVTGIRHGWSRPATRLGSDMANWRI